MTTIVHRTLLLALLLSQFAITVHAYEHDAKHNAASECELCVHHLAGKYGIIPDVKTIPANVATGDQVVSSPYTYQLTYETSPGNKGPPLSS